MPVQFRRSVRQWVSPFPGPPPVYRRVGGRELDGFNGEVVSHLIPHGRADTKDRLRGIARVNQLRRRELLPMPPSSLPFSRPRAFNTKDMKFDTEAFVGKFIRDQLERCTTCHVADLMRSSAKVTKKSASPSLLKVHMTSIAEKLKSFTDTDWNFRDVAAIIYGLQSFNEDDVGVMEIVSIMTDIVTESVSRNLPQRSQDISMILLGLQYIGSENAVTLRLLSLITTMTSNCKENFDEQNVGNALLGLQSMSSESAEVRSLLCALTVRIRGDNFRLSSQAVGNAVRGLRQMNSSCPEVRDLLSALTVRINECTAELNSQAVCDSLSGLRGMNCEHSEVRSLLSALILKYRASKRRMNGQEIGDALYSLQYFGDDSLEVRDILSVLLLKLSRLSDDQQPDSICRSLQGLQGMNAECPEVRSILVILAEKFLKIKKLTALDIGRALHGLNGLKATLDDAQYRTASGFLLMEAKRLTYGVNSSSTTPLLQSVSLNALQEFHQAVSFNLSKLEKLYDSKEYISWRVINLLQKEQILKREKDNLIASSPPPSV